jgi:hypothetical protein
MESKKVYERKQELTEEDVKKIRIWMIEKDLKSKDFAQILGVKPSSLYSALTLKRNNHALAQFYRWVILGWNKQ